MLLGLLPSDQKLDSVKAWECVYWIHCTYIPFCTGGNIPFSGGRTWKSSWLGDQRISTLLAYHVESLIPERKGECSGNNVVKQLTMYFLHEYVCLTWKVNHLMVTQSLQCDVHSKRMNSNNNFVNCGTISVQVHLLGPLPLWLGWTALCYTP